MVELKGTEKQVKWANALRVNFIDRLDFIKKIVDEIGITKDIAEELEFSGFKNLDDAYKVVCNQENSSKIINALKGHDFKKSNEKDKIILEKLTKKLANDSYVTEKVEQAIIEEKEIIVCSVLMLLSELI